MNSSVLIVAVLMGVLALATARPDDKYTTKYDNVDLDEILKSDRLLNNYVNCLLDKGRCTPDGTELKKNLPDAIENECSKCSEKQKEGTRKVLHFLVDKKPDTWKLLEAKYDPSKTYVKKYADELKKEGINL